ncbi:MAG: YggT family protein [Candidatus Binatia bacterium]
MVRAAHLEVDEAQRAADLGEVKQKLRHDVQESIERKAEVRSAEQSGAVEAVAQNLQRKAVSEVRDSELELERARRGARVNQFVDYLFFVAYGLIGLKIALELFGARDGNAFMGFLNVVTAPLLAPFRGLMPDPAVGGSQLMLSYIVALIVFGMVHLAVRGLLRVLVYRETKL